MNAERAIYLDSSAIVKLAVAEAESAALRHYLRGRAPLVSSALARTEVARALLPIGAAAVRRGLDVLRRIELVRISDRILVAAGAAGLLLGLPALRLRSDYFAIVTIAFSEIVRYVATNEGALTGGSQGTIALGKVGEAAQYNGQWERFQVRVQGWLHVSSSDVAMLVIVWTTAVVLLALVWLAVRTPWGRVLRAIREDEDAAASLGARGHTIFRRVVLPNLLPAILSGMALALTSTSRPPSRRPSWRTASARAR